MVRKELDHQIHSSPDLFQTHPNMTSVQSARGLVSIDQSEGRKSNRSKLHRAQRPDEDQSKSADRLKDDEGKPAASGAKLCQRGMEKGLEKPSSRNPAGKMWEAAMGRWLFTTSRKLCSDTLTLTGCSNCVSLYCSLYISSFSSSSLPHTVYCCVFPFLFLQLSLSLTHTLHLDR